MAKILHTFDTDCKTENTDRLYAFDIKTFEKEGMSTTDLQKVAMYNSFLESYANLWDRLMYITKGTRHIALVDFNPKGITLSGTYKKPCGNFIILDRVAWKIPGFKCTVTHACSNDFVNDILARETYAAAPRGYEPSLCVINLSDETYYKMYSVWESVMKELIWDGVKNYPRICQMFGLCLVATADDNKFPFAWCPKDSVIGLATIYSNAVEKMRNNELHNE
ncbi:MAG: hypothetical protein K2F99_03430 [Muribaculaceae bacterium]|nr:hypothetical protein [Muribaculaceae bacterium]